MVQEVPVQSLFAMMFLLAFAGSAFAAPPAPGRYLIVPATPGSPPFFVNCYPPGMTCEFDVEPYDEWVTTSLEIDEYFNPPPGTNEAEILENGRLPKCPKRIWFSNAPGSTTTGTYTTFTKECDPVSGLPDPQAPWIGQGGGVWIKVG